MKRSLLILVGIVALSAVAFAQNNGTTTRSVACDGSDIGVTPTCTVQIGTLLQAVQPEGLTLTVPNEIDFTIVPGQLNIGNKPLTAVTSWNLANSLTAGPDQGGYTYVVVDSWFVDDNALTATDGSGAVIAAEQIIGQIGNSGPQVAFVANTPYNSALTSQNLFPLYKVPVDATGIGSYTADLNLYIDARTGTTPIPVLTSPTAVYQGTVYTTAAAI